MSVFVLEGEAWQSYHHTYAKLYRSYNIIGRLKGATQRNRLPAMW